jgi:hypothetical protein
MAKTTIVQLTDDLDGGKADTTVSFGLDGVNYEIDLSEENVVPPKSRRVSYAASWLRAAVS